MNRILLVKNVVSHFESLSPFEDNPSNCPYRSQSNSEKVVVFRRTGCYDPKRINYQQEIWNMKATTSDYMVNFVQHNNSPYKILKPLQGQTTWSTSCRTITNSTKCNHFLISQRPAWAIALKE